MELMRIQGGAFYIGQTRYAISSMKREDQAFTDILDVDPELLEQVFSIPEPVSRIRQVEFEFGSGWCMSIIWGTNAMCENQNRGLMNHEQFREEVTNVEVGIFHKEHDIHVNPNTMAIGHGMWVEGFVDSARVKEILFFAAALPEPNLNDLAQVAYPGEVVEDIEEQEDLPDEDF